MLTSPFSRTMIDIGCIIEDGTPEDRMGNRSNYMAHGLISLPGNDREWSVYATRRVAEAPTFGCVGSRTASMDSSRFVLTTRVVIC